MLRAPYKLPIYLFAIDDFPLSLANRLANTLSTDLGLDIRVITDIKMRNPEPDPGRNQLNASLVLDKIHIKNIDKSPAYFIGLTQGDIYDPQTPQYRFVFSMRFFQQSPKKLLGQTVDNGFAIVSTYRLDPKNLGDPPNQQVMITRLTKMIKKNIGALYYRLPPDPDPRSVMFSGIDGVDVLDQIGQDF